MKTIQQTVFLRVLAATASCSISLCIVVFVMVAQEFRSELQSQSRHAADLILTLARTAAPSTFSNLHQDPPQAGEQNREYVLFIHDGAQVTYASWSAEPPDLSTLSGDRIVVEGRTYLMERQHDPKTNAVVAVGVLKQETYLASLEIVGYTVVVFLLVMGGMLWLIRRSIHVGLRPIHRLARAVSERHSTRLDPIELSVPSELRPIADATNTFLGDLRRTLLREREFISNAAHELRTPLTGIIAQIDAVPVQDVSDSVKAQLDKIRSSALRSARQVGQLLDLAFADSQADTATHPVDLREVLKDVLIERAPAALQQELDVELIADTPVMVLLPETSLQIIFQNLIGNAINYCARPGRILVQCDTSKNGVIVTISDNGPGLSSSEIALLTKRHNRGKPSLTADRGHGLGLSIVSELCLAMDLQLSFSQSKELGGLAVCVHMPLMDDPARPENAFSIRPGLRCPETG